MKFVKILPLFMTLSFFGIQSLAQDEGAETLESFQTRTGFQLSASGGLHILGGASNTNSDSIFGFFADLGKKYYFNPNIGVFIGLQYNKKGFEILSQSSKATYIDIPFGITFNSGPSWLFKTARSQFSLGGFIAIPVDSTFSGPLTLGFNNKTKSYFGVYLGSESLFQISDRWALGPKTFTKFGLGQAVESVDVKFTFELGIGLTISYL